MGWTENNRAEADRATNLDLIKAVKAVRRRLGDTQEAFAQRLGGLSKRAIANYESDRRPTVAVLARLAKTACDAGMNDEAGTFLLGMGDDLRLAELSLGLMSYSSNYHGYLLVPFKTKEVRRYARAFLEAVTQVHFGTDRVKKRKAQELLSDFSDEALELGGTL